MATVYREKKSGRWFANYASADGQRIRKSTGTADRAAAVQIANSWEKIEAMVRGGFVDSATVNASEAGRQPVLPFVDKYIEACRSAGQSKVHLKIKESQLRRFVAGAGAKVLNDLNTTTITKYLDTLKRAGKSNRTRNQSRMSVLSWFNWLIQNNHATSNPCKYVPVLNEATDRRRVRRALEGSELAKLFAANSQRRTYYMFAFYTGLRVRSCEEALWGHVEFDAATITVPAANIKGKRELILPIHPDLLAELKAVRPPFARPTDRIFPVVPNVLTFHRDCEKAGIARYDAAGRQIDRHALRTTLGTTLARSGVLPQDAARLLDHADIKTTLKHYTALTIADSTSALAKVHVPARFQEPAVTPQSA